VIKQTHNRKSITNLIWSNVLNLEWSISCSLIAKRVIALSWHFQYRANSNSDSYCALIRKRQCTCASSRYSAHTVRVRVRIRFILEMSISSEQNKYYHVRTCVTTFKGPHTQRINTNFPNRSQRSEFVIWRCMCVSQI
jgi:hypothetical protein